MGSMLEPSMCGKLSEVLGQNLSSLRIHTCSEADAFNRRIDATAFALGSDVYFRRGAFEPCSQAGMELIAHEAVHVCQQLAGRLPQSFGPEDPHLEQEARVLARPVAALMRGEPGSISAAEMTALREFRERQKAGSGQRATPGIQRTAAGMVATANIQPPAIAAKGPRTCHEAAIGWLLNAEGYASPWKLTFYVTNTFRIPNSTGRWVKNFIYANNIQLNRADTSGQNQANRPLPGDILFTVRGQADAMHSMVVVPTPGGGHATCIRGFNNLGTFNYPGVAVPAPAGAYDNQIRPIHDANLWNQAGTGFGANNAGMELRLVRYNAAAQRIRAALAHWQHSNWRGPLGGHGWQHVAPLFAHCPLSCPH